MSKEKISAVYQIKNSVTGDRYVGSSNDVERRWAEHKSPSRWKQCPDNPLYQDMQKYGLDKFKFLILAPIEPGYLKQVEQEFIELMKPTYNNYNANGQDLERYKEWWRSNKEAHRKCHKKYDNQLCSYNGETLTLCALSARFRKAGIEHPNVEARKYLISENKR